MRSTRSRHAAPRHPRSFLPAALAASLVAAGALVSGHAAAGWPPLETATADDMKDPANWPNDPSYAYSEDSDGQWNIYSFIPTQQPDSTLRPEETASGMSIDLAWRYTIGDPRVLILVTDSGIKWDEYDLIETAWLNYRELATHKPTCAQPTALDPCKQPDIPHEYCEKPETMPPELVTLLSAFDCFPENVAERDGILTVSDYKFTPTLTPEADAEHPKGDRNRNKAFDPGDLILSFSDGIDDDANGYVDDISGWDFMKDDNDPYDDTRYGHGTGEARDSTSAANNMAGSAGVCPLCRHIPGRVGDSFIADVQAFAEAVVYATDNKASVVQCALGTINMTRFAQEALDYAYSKDVLVVTSMADENARHHNMPAAANHTLPVHAIQFAGPKVTNAQTFLDYHPCSNFGGQNLLSASGTGCSSEATGMLSGISGLLYAASFEYLVGSDKPPLTPGEAHQLFFKTADDIDVEESRVDPESPWKWSQFGFDQRFGYGRVNANAAIEALKHGRIPPAIDVVSPRWFDILYKNQVTGPVEIVGTVSAKRADAYSVFAEWAPGVQPEDGQFQVFAKQENIPADTVLGGEGPLATLDIRTIDFKPATPEQRDVDSPNGENDYTITVRIRAVAHYGADGDVPGEMRRTYYIHDDPDLAEGFPIFLGDSGEGSPKMADLDGDGVRDLVYPTAGGDLHAYKLGPAGPELLPGFPFRAGHMDGLTAQPISGKPNYRAAPAYATGGVDADLGRESLTTAPAIADLEGDGSIEIVFATWTGTIYVIGTDAQLKPGWPKRLPEVPSCPLDPAIEKPALCMDEKMRIARGAFAAPVLADMDKDGKLDIIQAAFDGHIHVYDAAGSVLEGWPLELHYSGKFKPEPDRNRILTTPAVADFNGDGIPDLLVGSNERLGQGGQAGAIYLVDGRGKKAPAMSYVFPNWPVTMTSFQLFPLVAEGVPNSGVIGNFDGVPAAIMHGNVSAPLILPLDPGDQTNLGDTPTNALPVNPTASSGRGVDPTSLFGLASKLTEANTMFPLFAQPSLGDVDQDGVLDVVTSGGSLSLALTLQGSAGGDSQGDHLLVMWSGKTGAMLPASPILIEDYTFFNSQAIVDLNGDDYPEVLTGSGSYILHAFDACGREPTGWPKFTGQWIIPTPAVGDLDGDHKLEVAVGTRNGWLYVWHTPAGDDSLIEWESFHHDNRNTGTYETPLEQGKQGKHAKKPLTLESCAVPETPTDEDEDLRVSGGCSCRTTGRAPGGALAALALLGAFGVLRRRTSSRPRR